MFFVLIQMTNFTTDPIAIILNGSNFKFAYFRVLIISPIIHEVAYFLIEGHFALKLCPFVSLSF